MKTKLLTAVILSYVMLLVIACNPKKEEAVALVDTAQIKNEIQAKENEFAATYNEGELKNIGYYADDATSFSQNKAPLVGKASIVEYLVSNLTANNKRNKLAFTTNEIYVSNAGNQVLEIGHYTVTDSTNATVNSGNYMSLFVKRDGKYVCLRDMSTSEIPLD